MSTSLPTDIIFHILSFLPLSDICQLITATNTTLNFYVKQVLLARVKYEGWSIVLFTPAIYFAVLCNRDMLAYSSPIAKLTCVGYNSCSEHLRFETVAASSFEMSDDEELEFQSIRIYCSQWFNFFHEDDKSGHIKLGWCEGEQTKQLDDDLWIGYNCTKKALVSAEENCSLYKYNNRCNKHAFTTAAAASSCNRKRVLEIHSIRVSLNWLKQGLIK
jgi:hypothetical protein